MQSTINLTLKDIENADTRLRGQAVVTPMLESPALNTAVRGRVLLKPECLQRTGSFKFRGAYNRMVQLDRAEREAGVVAWSSGNHAQGVAAAAQLLGTHATIVMPSDAPRQKLASTLEYGAEVVECDRYREDREAIARKIAQRTGAALVPSYDHIDVIAGQGTVGLEFARQLRAADVRLDTLLVCCGGGGLIAGIATVFAELSPQTVIYAVEPAGFDDTARSLTAGRRLRNSEDTRSICDALLAEQPGSLTFPINSKLLRGGLSVTDEQVLAAMRFAFAELKLVVEPGGAVALAAALSDCLDLTDQNVGVVISGGNVDAELFTQAICLT